MSMDVWKDVYKRQSQTYEYFEMIQDRILTFVSNHADIAYDQLRELMHLSLIHI